MDETDKDFAPAETSKRPTASRSRDGGREAEAPRYNLTTAQYLHDRYYSEGIEIVYRGTPNEGMEPLNAAAEARVDEWLNSLPAPPMRHEDFIMQAIANRPRHDAPVAPTATKRTASRLMGKETPEEELVEVVPVDPRRVKGPKKQMGTIVAEIPSPGSI